MSTSSAKLLLARDTAGMTKHAAQLVLEAAAASFRAQQRFVFCLAGGSTPRKLYELLSEPYYRERVDWANTVILFGDERCVPSTDPESNYGMAKKAFLSKVPLSENHIYRMAGEMTPPADAAKTYEQSMRALFKGSVPKIDLLLLGVGEDGHIASLFPRTEALGETDKWVVATHVQHLGSTRLTMTLPIINNARRILFLVSGDSKAAIVREIFRSDLPTNRYPAQMVSPYNGEITWLFDKAAMAKCPDELRHTAFHL